MKEVALLYIPLFLRGGGLHEGAQGVAFLYISLFLREGWFKRNSIKVYGRGLQEGGGLQERIRYIHV